MDNKVIAVSRGYVINRPDKLDKLNSLISGTIVAHNDGEGGEYRLTIKDAGSDCAERIYAESEIEIVDVINLCSESFHVIADDEIENIAEYLSSLDDFIDNSLWLHLCIVKIAGSEKKRLLKDLSGYLYEAGYVEDADMRFCGFDDKQYIAREYIEKLEKMMEAEEGDAD